MSTKLIGQNPYDRFPLVFPLIYRGITRYISCGDGWFNLIYELSKNLEEIAKKQVEANEEPICIDHIKEKFGLLRFYANNLTEAAEKLIIEAEEKSQVICEECGEEGSLNQLGYWIRTLCVDCAKATDR